MLNDFVYSVYFMFSRMLDCVKFIHKSTGTKQKNRKTNKNRKERNQFFKKKILVATARVLCSEHIVTHTRSRIISFVYWSRDCVYSGFTSKLFLHWIFVQFFFSVSRIFVNQYYIFTSSLLCCTNCHSVIFINDSRLIQIIFMAPFIYTRQRIKKKIDSLSYSLSC